jgi:hypothetical protein
MYLPIIPFIALQNAARNRGSSGCIEMDLTLISLFILLIIISFVGAYFISRK